MIIVGIDPGKKGAICARPLSSHPDVEIDLEVMPPVIESFIDLMERAISWANMACGDVHVFIEKAQSMPKQGISSAFNYGTHFGELLGVIQTLKMPHTLVPPGTWTRTMHQGTKAGAPKARSLEAARRLFPYVNLLATPRSKVAHDGLVDALLIAEWGRRQLVKA